VAPDISVIIAAYNVECYIERAINSALTQTDSAEAPAIEVIVVDDGSTDGTWKTVSHMSDPRLQCIRLSGNSGPGIARNVGIARASGYWIAILDGDDAFLPGRLTRLMKLAADQKADIVVDNLSVFRESTGASFPMFSSSRLARLSLLGLPDFIAGNQSFLGGYTLGYMKPVISAEFLRQHGLCYHADLRIGEDYLLLAQSLAAGARCVVDPTAGYLYTSRAGSVSNRLIKEDILRIIASDAAFLSVYKLPPVAMKAQRRREDHLKEAYAFACLVEVIKSRRLFRALLAAAAAPMAARHLWRPVWKRARRIMPILVTTRKENQDVRNKEIIDSRQNT
jgi:succinoglycan biosynthesis protein ExoO